LLDGPAMDQAILLHELHRSIHALADAIADEPDVARALRRLAARLPEPGEPPPLPPPPPPPPRRRPAPLRPLLYRALADGVLDARRFDHAMLVGRRATQLAAGRT